MDYFSIVAGGVDAIVRAVRRRDVSCVDLTTYVLQRIADLDAGLQAWRHVDRTGALESAAILDRRIEKGEEIGVLGGVPFGIKEQFDVEGSPNVMRAGGDLPRARDASAVRRLKHAGAVAIGTTTMSLKGAIPATKNPWNRSHTPGGSSGGSGVAVAARMVPIALGEQTGGSNLRPASFNGVVGFKGTFGRVATDGCAPFAWSQDHVGIMGLRVQDIQRVYPVLDGHASRPDRNDGQSLENDVGRPIRIGVLRDFFPAVICEEMLETVRGASAKLHDAGASIGEVRLPFAFHDVWAAFKVSGDAEQAVTVLSQGVVGESCPGASIPATHYIQALRMRGVFANAAQREFAQWDAILMPGASGDAPEGLEYTGDPSTLLPWTFFGLPSISVPGGLSRRGLPLGMQLVAAANTDYRLLAVSEWCERVLDLAGRSGGFRPQEL